MGAEMCGDFFDQIDDLLVFPNDDLGGFVLGGEGGGVFEDVLAMSSSTSTGDSLLTELSVPCEDIAQLEWLSNFVEDSFSARNIIDLDNHSPNNDSTYQTAASPISVLESSTCSKEFIPLKTLVPSRARSKRPRPASLSSRSVSHLSPTSSETSSISFVSPSSKILPNSDDDEQEEKKKKKRKLRLGSPRKCLHCGIEKTPQWRAGPMGPRTLCNACGVRYMSGRLYPEYRPAASPTFVASKHSCSHKKVMEMRMKGGHKEGFALENIHLIDSV